MIRLAGAVLACIGLLSLPACEPHGGPPGNTLNRHDLGKVAIISHLGDRMKRTFYGTTVIENIRDSNDVSPWQIDAHVIGKMKQHIPDAEAVEIGETATRKLRGEFGIEEWVTRQLRTSGYDSYLIALPTNWDFRDIMPAGYGILQEATFFRKSPGCVYALFDVRLVDARNGKTVASSPSFDAWNGYPCRTAMPVRERFSDYSEQELQRLRTDLYGELDRGVDYALGKIGLR